VNGNKIAFDCFAVIQNAILQHQLPTAHTGFKFVHLKFLPHNEAQIARHSTAEKLHFALSTLSVILL